MDSQEMVMDKYGKSHGKIFCQVCLNLDFAGSISYYTTAPIPQIENQGPITPTGTLGGVYFEYKSYTCVEKRGETFLIVDLLLPEGSH